MDEIEVVIKIPEEWIEQFKAFKHPSTLETIILQGTVLPKGHGGLIDKESLIKAIEQKAKRLKNLDTINGLCGAVALAYEAKTVIEADKEEKND